MAASEITNSAPSSGETEQGPGNSFQIRADEKYPLVLDHTHPIATECFGILRSRLVRAQAKLDIRTILLTSPGMEDGKTLITVNLALSLGHLARKSVLLIDGDLRAKGATRLLKMESLPGLGELLLGQNRMEELVRPTTFPVLSVLPAGHVSDKSLPELLAGPMWHDLLEHAKRKYDMVLVDSVPAAAPVADIELLAAHCDAVLLVVQMRKTTRASLSAVPKRLDRQKILGVVINNADELSRYDYNYYQYYSPQPK